MFFFRVKPMRISEKDVSWFDGSHTSAVAAVPHVMSADDEMTVWEVSRFLYKVLQRRNDIVTSQTDTYSS